MRFDTRTISLITYLGILLFNVYALSLYFRDQLTLYIHPRYVLFTALFNAASALVCLAGFAFTSWRMIRGEEAHIVGWRPSFTLAVAAMVLVVAYALPAHTLSSEIAAQRSSNFNVAQASVSGSGAANTLALFSADTSQLSIADWVSAFNLRANASFYKGKKVDVVGFVFHPKSAPPEVFYVSRFKVTCCVVDAQPVGLPVRWSGWRKRFHEDEWVRVTGTFAKPEKGVAEPAIIAPRSVEPTHQPKHPYIVQ